MSELTVDFIGHLVAKVPDLEPLLQEHLSDNFGEVLPHVFFGDITRFVVAEFLRAENAGTAEQASSSPLKPLLAELEDAVSQSGEVAELVCVSFLENLPRPSEPGGGVRELVGPGLRSELDRIG